MAMQNVTKPCIVQDLLEVQDGPLDFNANKAGKVY